MECNNLCTVLSERQFGQLPSYSMLVSSHLGESSMSTGGKGSFSVQSNYTAFSPLGKEFLQVNHFYLSAFIQSHEKETCIIKANCPSQLRSDRVLRGVFHSAHWVYTFRN